MERFYNIIRSPFSILTVSHAFNIIACICVDKNMDTGLIEGYAGTVFLYKLSLKRLAAGTKHVYPYSLSS